MSNKVVNTARRCCPARHPPWHPARVETSLGARLALLLLEGFEAMTDRVVTELAAAGHPGVTATHEFALRAVDQGAGDASSLARALGVSRQAAAKTVEALEELGYVERAPDAVDGRRKRLTVTPRGHEMSAVGGAAFDDLRELWRRAVGADDLRVVETSLLALLDLLAVQEPAAGAARTRATTGR